MDTNVAYSAEKNGFTPRLYYAYCRSEETPDNPYRLHYEIDLHFLPEGARYDLASMKSDKGRENDWYFAYTLIFGWKHPNNRLGEFLDFHFQHYADAEDFLLSTKILIERISIISGSQKETQEYRKRIALDWIERKQKWLFELIKESDLPELQPKLPFDKLKWLGGPKDFGFIFHQLCVMGYIDQPMNYRGEHSAKIMAKRLLQLFDVDGKEDSILKALSDEGTLSEYNKSKFSIPNRSDLK